jgi:exodeoxyribonuclease-1
MLKGMSKSEPSFYFYDLETSGFDAKNARIMQFAGQRTSLALEPIGEPHNVLIKITPDVLPDPDAILVTGITPQQTLMDGLTEAEFLKLFFDEVVQPGTTFVGFNTVRFDDEFMRNLLYRNFYDPYEWQWQDDNSRWDILDLVRMTRALRPDGIEWPVAADGRPTNRLEALAAVNKLMHDHAHDALSDVYATTGVAKLIRTKQPDLFNFLYEHRRKDAVKQLIAKPQPFVYTTGRYSSAWLHTSAAVMMMPHPEQDSALVYDLRFDPTEFASKTPEELVEHWRFSRDPDHVRLPVKTLKYNRCPAVAPLGVLNEEAQKRLELPLKTVEKNYAALKKCLPEFGPKVIEAIRLLDAERGSQQQLVVDSQTVDSLLYDGFFDKAAKTEMALVRATAPNELSKLTLKADERLSALLPLYKARNFPAQLTAEERLAWDEFCRQRLQSGGISSWLAKFGARLQALADTKLTEAQRYILQELQFYAESIVQLDPEL